MKKLVVIGFAIVVVVIGIVLIRKRAPMQEARALVVWHTESSPDTHAVLASVNKEFEATYGVPVKCEYVSWSQLSTKLNIALETDPSEMLPDISHLQPYMAYPLYYDGQLVDISDVVEEVRQSYSKTGIRASVADLQRFDGRYYGLAQHVGVSFIFYNAELLKKHGLTAPTTWAEFFEVCAALSSAEGGDFRAIAMPGSSPFFMECIFSEYLNSRGARLFDDAGRPHLLGNNGVSDVLKVFAQMSRHVTRDFERLEYLGQFQKLVDGDAAFVMFAGARACSTFEKLEGTGTEPLKYLPLVPPRFAAASHPSFTSVDCEPWVLMKERDSADLAKKWLRLLYAKANYLEFCESVPIQLIPVSADLDADYAKNNTVKKWQSWYDHATSMIDGQRVRPYFMQKGDRQDLDFLFKLYNKQILYRLVMACVRSGEVTEQHVAAAEEEIREVIKRFSRTVNIGSE